jgi:hypothetical protein
MEDYLGNSSIPSVRYQLPALRLQMTRVLGRTAEDPRGKLTIVEEIQKSRRNLGQFVEN